jgi:hypothetical protein
MPTHTHAVSGERVPALDGFDAVMQRCLAEHGVPGAALAVDLPTSGAVGQQHHNGMLPGSASVLRRRDDGITWAALFNRAKGRKKQYLGAAVVELMALALGQVKEWPTD